MEPLKKQTTQIERTKPRLASHGGGFALSQAVVLLGVKAFGIEFTPEETLQAAMALVAISSALHTILGLVVSRYGK